MDAEQTAETTEYSQLSESVNALQLDNFMLQETVRDLELALDTVDWRRMTHFSKEEFSRRGIGQIADMARLFFLKNPLIQRGATVQSLYVWGQGWSVRAKDEDVQVVIDDFLEDLKNQSELTSQQALKQKEIEQQTDSNTFLVFFTNKTTGRVRVRSIPLDEMLDIYCSPDDAKEPWYYRREWTVETFTETGAVQTENRQAYYPDWNYNPTVKPDQIGGLPVMWDSPVFHIKTGGFSNWKFGVSELYAALDWAKAYKDFLEDFASIIRAHRRFAWDVSVPGGKPSIAAAKAKFGTTVGDGVNGGGTGRGGYDTNPPPVTGSAFIHGDSTSMAPIRTAGATVPLEEGRRLALMTFAALGLPETFFGDVSVGTLATATSLDRPTELKMRDRQLFWQSIFTRIFDYVKLQAVKATRGPLSGMGAVTGVIEDGQREETIDWGIDPHVDIDFPPILNAGLLEQVQAIVTASTLNGGALAGTVDIVTLSRMLLSALGEDDIDEIIDNMFPNGDVPDWADPEKRAEQAAQMGQSEPAEDKPTVTAKEAAVLKRKLLELWEAKR